MYDFGLHVVQLPSSVLNSVWVARSQVISTEVHVLLYGIEMSVAQRSRLTSLELYNSKQEISSYSALFVRPVGCL